MGDFEGERCPLCVQNTRKNLPIPNRDAREFDCERCGQFSMTRQAFHNARTMDEEIRRFLKCATRQAYEVRNPLLLKEDQIDTIAADHARTSIPGNIEKLLHFIASRCPRPGDSVDIDIQRDYPAIDAAQHAELNYILNAA